MNQNKVAQVAPVLGGRGNTGGERDAARQLGLDRDDVRRARKVASLTPNSYFIIARQLSFHIIIFLVKQEADFLAS